MVAGEATMIPCPRCGGTNTIVPKGRNTRARLSRGVVVRYHECRDCAMTFPSFQLVVTDRAVAEAIMDAIEAAA
jgi:transposase-like protein